MGCASVVYYFINKITSSIEPSLMCSLLRERVILVKGTRNEELEARFYILVYITLVLTSYSDWPKYFFYFLMVLFGP